MRDPHPILATWVGTSPEGDVLVDAATALELLGAKVVEWHVVSPRWRFMEVCSPTDVSEDVRVTPTRSAIDFPIAFRARWQIAGQDLLVRVTYGRSGDVETWREHAIEWTGVPQRITADFFETIDTLMTFPWAIETLHGRAPGLRDLTRYQPASYVDLSRVYLSRACFDPKLIASLSCGVYETARGWWLTNVRDDVDRVWNGLRAWRRIVAQGISAR